MISRGMLPPDLIKFVSFSLTLRKLASVQEVKRSHNMLHMQNLCKEMVMGNEK